MNRIIALSFAASILASPAMADWRNHYAPRHEWHEHHRHGWGPALGLGLGALGGALLYAPPRPYYYAPQPYVYVPPPVYYPPPVYAYPQPPTYYVPQSYPYWQE